MSDEDKQQKDGEKAESKADHKDNKEADTKADSGLGYTAEGGGFVTAEDTAGNTKVREEKGAPEHEKPGGQKAGSVDPASEGRAFGEPEEGGERQGETTPGRKAAPMSEEPRVVEGAELAKAGGAGEPPGGYADVPKAEAAGEPPADAPKGDADAEREAKVKAAAEARAARLAAKAAQTAEAGDAPAAEAAAPTDADKEAKAKAAAEARAARASARAAKTEGAEPEAPKEPSPKQPLLDRLTAILKEFREGIVEDAVVNEKGGHIPTVSIQAEAWPDTAAMLRTHPELELNYLRNVSGVDMETHMEVVYHLISLDHKQDYCFKVKTDRQTPSVPSITPIFPTADWNEREIYDLFGIDFPGHPDLRRIMMADDWVGHPLRKDYEPIDPEV
ncbi:MULTISPECIES: NADH-quinone oxidoreductase subunit C [Paenibacillus]|uniref:NADH-quinone oxidoreductase subunit C n=1 Tax=Paenibacillus TaxID=44249 RepID=UPI0022B93F0C|nr:NADH-quinone oxidoreductase subunit C [Paenibacillus caseinilyticus]MCZ8523353.1 NADH-quinone oxidoreductase subunit C [Paenibacillus caseinilyticus]